MPCDPVGAVRKATSHRPGERAGGDDEGRHTDGMSDGKLLFVATDDRGCEMEVVAVPLKDGDLLVIHVMPTALRRNSP